MKVKFGEITKDVKRYTNEINRTEWGDTREQLSVEIEDTAASVSELDGLFVQNFQGDLALVGENTEEAFAGFKYEGVRKSYDGKNRQVTVMFRKSVAEGTPEN